MIKGNTIQERFSLVFSIIKDNFVKYILLNLGLIGIWLVLGVVLIGIFSLILFFILGLNYKLLINISSIYDISFSIVIGIVLFLLFFIFLFRILKAISFIGNFYLTKFILENKEISFNELFSLSFSKLFKKAIIDFWGFLIGLGFISILALFIGLLSLFKLSSSFIVIFIFLFSIFYLILFIKLIIWFYFSDYHCFYQNKFDFKTYLSAKEIAFGKQGQILGNIVVLIIFTSILSSVVSMIFGLGNIDFLGNNISFGEGYYSLLALLFSFSFIAYLILRYLINLLIGVFSFIYFFIYYKILVSKEDLIENNLKDKEY